MQVNGTPLHDLNRLKIYNHTWFHITRPGGYMGSPDGIMVGYLLR